MRQVRRLKWLVLLSLIAVPASAESYLLVNQLFVKADTIFVGSVESIRRTTDAAILAKTALRGSFEGYPAHPCEVTIRVAAVLKAKGVKVKEGTLQPVIWYTPDVIPCQDGVLGFETEVSNPRLWFLRTENGILRYVIDDGRSSRTLRKFSPEIKREMEEWKDPAVEIEYLLLKPGVGTEESRYAEFANDGNISWVTGFVKLLKVLRAVYLDSDDYMRGQISLHVASYGMCLESARGEAKDEGKFDEWASRVHLLDADYERLTDAVFMKGIQWWTSKDLLVETNNIAMDQTGFSAEERAIDSLTWDACESLPQERAHSRKALHDFFGVDLASLPCIPCE
jgi:hypothetical protein